ncbi:bifunctional helix-turn-helix transcriptional regulator/GNAT family N-acetyltransferase [Mesobacterium pallidum]|uniref:bifunctional helix-turn-helix transcriptional regulator/GNAT family N-acetyltransferase n=1 Tax=Mesobacterium pallidum TaxID=2872037 RepID=UPI001EE30A5C|nr:helix-turn-helix domain-containing GNAT family N-acetyltransferase [Mesobacterium pallidum]
MPLDPEADPLSDPDVAEIRAFNRFHTGLVGALDNHFLGSDYTLPQMRVLYEIAHAPEDAPVTAVQLTEALGMDKGYLSRILKRLEKDGLVVRRALPGGGRQRALVLTEAGRAEYAGYDRASAQSVATCIAHLPPVARAELVSAMRRIRLMLDPGPRPEAVLRAPRPGELSLVAHRQIALYGLDYGWRGAFEGLVLEITGQFLRGFDPAKEAAWVADMGGEVVGSVFLCDGGDGVAKLRLLYLDALARGQGLGRRLVTECMDHARRLGYRHMILWTNDPLTEARRLYASLGFTCTASQPHADFGVEMTGETWECAL